MWQLAPVGVGIVVFAVIAWATGSLIAGAVALVFIGLIVAQLYFVKSDATGATSSNSRQMKPGRQPFSILRHLDAEILAASGPNRKIKAIYLSNRYYFDYLMATQQMYHHPIPLDGKVIHKWRGITIYHSPPTEFCRGCGAPVHDEECDYCKLPSEYIRISDEPIVDGHQHHAFPNQG